MLNHRNRLGWPTRRRHTLRMRRRRSQEANPKLLDAVWDALNIARDNKALLLVRQGIIVNLNGRAAELCGHSDLGVKDWSITELLEDGPPSVAIECWQTWLKAASGMPIAVEVTRQPLSVGPEEIQVYAIRDLRERRAAAEERRQLNALLAEQHEQLDAALENMLQGLAMFDAEQRLIICNQRYADMYGLSADQVKPGTTVRQIFEYRISNGFYHVHDAETFVDSWTDNFGEISSRIQELADGRIICVTRRSMATGGILVTHEDVTERQKLHDRLEQQHKLLESQEEKLRLQNLLLEAAVNNMVQGLAMFDTQQRLILSNRRYAEIYGLSPEQVKLGTTLQEIIRHRSENGLQSIKSSEEIVDSMLCRSDEINFGQFYNQLCDGRCVATDGQWRYRHHTSRHYGTAALRGQDCPHGSARYFDRSSQPRTPQRAAGTSVDAR
jgi:PAS domain-containing protein